MTSSTSHLLTLLLFSFLTLLPSPSYAAPVPAPEAGINIAISILDDLNNVLSPTNSNATLPTGLAAFLGNHAAVVWQNGFKEVGMGGGMDGMNRTGGQARELECPRMSVVFARGTGEPGNVGILTGPPFFAALGEYMNGTNQLAIQGVDYEALPAGFFAGGSMIGAAKMASLITTSLSLCPSTPLLLSGYSQGSQLIHLATSMLPSNTTSKITSVVMFGDPKNGTKIEGVDERRVKTVCHEGDDICKGGASVRRDHLNYFQDGREAAAWVMRMGMGDPGLGILS